MKKYLWLTGFFIIAFFAIGKTIDPNELPFGGYDLRQYNENEVSRLADSLGFNLWFEYGNKLQEDSILMLSQKGIQSIRGGLIPLGNDQWDAEAPFKYSWSNYAVIDVGYPYQNDEVRMVPLQGDFWTDSTIWISYRDSAGIKRDTLGGISTYMACFDDEPFAHKAKTHVVFYSKYFFGFPVDGRIHYQTDIYMKIDSRCDSARGDRISDTVAFVYWALQNSQSGNWYQICVGAIKADSFQNDTFKKISLPDTIFPNDTAMFLTMFLVTNGKRQVSVDSIVISDRFGRDLIENSLHPYDEAIITKFLEYANNGTLENSIYGWLLMDEPHYSNLLPFKHIYDLMHSDTINMDWIPVTWFDKYGDLNGSYLKLVGTKFVLNDIYPFGRTNPYAGQNFQSFTGNTTGPLYRLNLHLSWCRAKIDSFNTRFGDTREFWFTPQAFRDDSTWRYPTPAELSCETFMGLCWGAKGIVYYKYDTDSSTNTYREFGIRHKGVVTPLYNVIRDRIGPYINAIDSTYTKLKWDTSYTYHNPDSIPAGSIIDSIDAQYQYPCHCVRNNAEYPTDIGWFHVGEFKDDFEPEVKYFMLVNRSCSLCGWDSTETSPVIATVNLNPAIVGSNYALIIDLAKGTSASDWTGYPETTYSGILDGSIPYTVNLKAGEGRLFRLEPTTSQYLQNRSQVSR